MDSTERSKLIAKYNDGYNEVSDALEGFSDRASDGSSASRQMDRLRDNSSPGRQRKHLCPRLRKLLVEDRPVIQGYDQDQFAIQLKYNERDSGPALDAFRAARATTAQLLEIMSDDDWQREGEHTESGRYTAETWLAIYAEHAHNHAAQIRRLRSALKI